MAKITRIGPDPLDNPDREPTDLERGVARRMRRARLKRGWSILELATRAGLYPDELLAVESEIAPMNIAQLFHAAGALGISVDWFLEPDLHVVGT